jgi:hypothetical protein
MNMQPDTLKDSPQPDALVVSLGNGAASAWTTFHHLPAMSPEHPILELLTPPRTYTVSDLLHWADFSGELYPHWTEFLSALACQQQAAADELNADTDQLQAMSEDFRYRYDITTVEETEKWLEERRVDLENFTDWLERRYWRGAIKEPSGKEQPFALAGDELQALFVADAIFSDALNQLGRNFGRRLIAHYHPSAEAGASSDDLEVMRRHFLQSHQFEPADTARWLEALGRDPLWLDEMIVLEAAYQAERRDYFTPARKSDALRSLRLPLTRFHLELIELSDLDTAREAALCLRESGQPMTALAEETGFSCSTLSLFADELTGTLQQRLLSAAPGEILEPEPIEEGYRVCRVAGKEEPSLDDPAVNLQLEQRLLDAAFAERCHQHLRASLRALNL